MNISLKTTFQGVYETDAPGIVENFRRLISAVTLTVGEIRDFVDATGGAQSRYLPDIVAVADKDYYFVKTDSSVNAVTIYAAGTDTIEGAASIALAAQYDWVKLRPYNGVWYITP